MRNIFEVSKEEKNRILNLHENATRKQYIIKEQDVQQTSPEKSVRVEYLINDKVITGAYINGELFVSFPSGKQEKMPPISDLTEQGKVTVTDYPELIKFNEQIHKENLAKLYSTDSDNQPSDEEKNRDLFVKMRNEFHVPTFEMVPDFNPVGVVCTVDSSRKVLADQNIETIPGKIVG